MKIEQKYKTILADPPWYESGGGKIKRGADKHYSLMKTKDIMYYMSQIPMDDNAHLYLWVTNNFLLDGIAVMESLGFRYVTNRVWIKDKIGLGQYFRGQHELLLFGIKGRLPYKQSTTDTRSKCIISTIIKAKRTKHSQKPRQVYVDIEKTSYPPYLEVFAREHREGWDVWGNEIPNTTQKILKDMIL
jgi:N6-adenosine-specific RNA methylase IME4